MLSLWLAEQGETLTLPVVRLIRERWIMEALAHAFATAPEGCYFHARTR